MALVAHIFLVFCRRVKRDIGLCPCRYVGRVFEGEDCKRLCVGGQPRFGRLGLGDKVTWGEVRSSATRGPSFDPLIYPRNAAYRNPAVSDIWACFC